MHPQWPLLVRLFLLIPVLSSSCLYVNAQEGAEAEASPDWRESAVEEPVIQLPEVTSESPFRMISRTRRRDTEDQLVLLCREAVDTTSRRMLSTDLHTPWQMMHALLGLRHDFVILHNNEPVSGLDWIAKGQSFDNEYWFEKTRFGGRAHPYSRPYAFEGHANQFLAILSMCGVELDREFGTANGTVTMREMIQHAQMSVSEKDEPTWTLWALSRYLPPTARWRNAAGEVWSIEKLVQDQCSKPIVRGAPCGGTHALFALAHARNVYLRSGKPLRGVWLQAEYKIRQYINTARIQQNSNGTLSSNFFRERKYDPDYNKRMASSGHLLEFLMLALPQEELNSRWVRRAIEATARDLLSNKKAYVKCSPLYHSVNALNIYLDRVNPKLTPENVAENKKNTRTAIVPKPVPPATALKPVPVRRISTSKDVTTEEDEAVSDEDTDATATDEPAETKDEPQQDAAVETSDKASTAEDNDAEDAPTVDEAAETEAAEQLESDTKPDEAKPTESPAKPAAAARLTVSAEPKKERGWTATPKARQTPFAMAAVKIEVTGKSAQKATSRSTTTKAATAAGTDKRSPVRRISGVESEGRNVVAVPAPKVEEIELKVLQMPAINDKEQQGFRKPSAR